MKNHLPVLMISLLTLITSCAGGIIQKTYRFDGKTVNTIQITGNAKESPGILDNKYTVTIIFAREKTAAPVPIKSEFIIRGFARGVSMRNRDAFIILDRRSLPLRLDNVRVEFDRFDAGYYLPGGGANFYLIAGTFVLPDETIREILNSKTITMRFLTSDKGATLSLTEKMISGIKDFLK